MSPRWGWIAACERRSRFPTLHTSGLTPGSRPELYDVAPLGLDSGERLSLAISHFAHLGAHAQSYMMSPHWGWIAASDFRSRFPTLHTSGLTPRAI